MLDCVTRPSPGKKLNTAYARRGVGLDDIMMRKIPNKAVIVELLCAPKPSRRCLPQRCPNMPSHERTETMRLGLNPNCVDLVHLTQLTVKIDGTVT